MPGFFMPKADQGRPSVNDEGPQDMTPDAAESRIATFVKRIVDEAPPLSDEQRAKLIVLLQPIRQRRTEAAREALRSSKRGVA
jgi:hypothetical protein